MTKKGLLYQLIPQKLYYKVMFKHFIGYSLNMKNPKTYTEKLWWLKKYYESHKLELLRKCYDKYTVRDYIKEKTSADYLSILYGVYDDASQIDFNKLPESFVLKVTQSCGYNIIVVDKSMINIETTIRQLNKWLDIARTKSKIDYAEQGYLYDGKARLICEEYIHDEKGLVPSDIGFFCFNGKPEFITYDISAMNPDGSRNNEYFRNTYDTDWNFIPVNMGRPFNDKITVNRPDNLDEMVEMVSKLSSDFPFARIDVYNAARGIICGEITWTPQGGAGRITPIEYDYKFGSMLKLPCD